MPIWEESECGLWLEFTIRAAKLPLIMQAYRRFKPVLTRELPST